MSYAKPVTPEEEDEEGLSDLEEQSDRNTLFRASLGRIPLPWPGHVHPEWCRGIRFNYGLHTQCMRMPIAEG